MPDRTENEDWFTASIEAGRQLLTALPRELKAAVDSDARFREAMLLAERKSAGNDS